MRGGIGAAEWRRGRRRHVRGGRSGVAGGDGKAGVARCERGDDRLGLDPRGSAATAGGDVDPEYADAKTLLALLAIRALCEDGDRSRVLPITAEIRLARNQQEAKNAVQGGKLALTCVPV